MVFPVLTSKGKIFPSARSIFNRGGSILWTVNGDRNERSHDPGENAVQKLRISKPQFLNLIR